MAFFSQAMRVIPSEIHPSASAGSAPALRKHGALLLVFRRFLVPAFVVSVVALLRWRARVSTRAEVELSGNLRLGAATTVSSFTKIKTTDGPLHTGRECGFATGCFVAAGAGGIHMGDHVLCGPNVVIVASNYRYAELEVPFERQGVTSIGIRIGRNVWIGANCTIADGAEIGDDTIVVANSLVNRRFPPGVILQGNPAKVILTRRPAITGDAHE